jgi:hypothetical protein
MWVFPCQYYFISAPYSLLYRLSVLYNLINWQRCWITHLKNRITLQCLIMPWHVLMRNTKHESKSLVD